MSDPRTRTVGGCCCCYGARGEGRKFETSPKNLGHAESRSQPELPPQPQNGLNDSVHVEPSVGLHTYEAQPRTSQKANGILREPLRNDQSEPPRNAQTSRSASNKEEDQVDSRPQIVKVPGRPKKPPRLPKPFWATVCTEFVPLDARVDIFLST